MSYREWTDRYDPTASSTASSSSQTSNNDGLQDELHDRWAVLGAPVVVSGFVASIVGTSVTFSAGDAYTGGGLRFASASSRDFSGETAGTYYVYIDESAETTGDASGQATPAISTTAPTAPDLLLCQVAWDGTALSSLVDMRPLKVLDDDDERLFLFARDVTTSESGAFVARIASGFLSDDIRIDGLDVECDAAPGTAESVAVSVSDGTNTMTATVSDTATGASTTVGAFNHDVSANALNITVTTSASSATTRISIALRYHRIRPI